MDNLGLFRCTCCDEVLTTDEQGTCESYDNNFCLDCHAEVCYNMGLCEIAGNHV